MHISVRTADEPTLRLLDSAVAAWMVLWIVVGAWSGYTTWQLSDLGDTVSSSGGAITSAGNALQSLEGVPVVGEQPAELGRETSATGEEIQARGQEVKGELRQLAVLLGLAIAVMPTTPVLGLYLPLRGARRRERAEIARGLTASGSDAAFDRYLAERAVTHLSWAEVRQIEPDPWQALAGGRHRALADAELHRLGLSRSGDRG